MQPDDSFSVIPHQSLHPRTADPTRSGSVPLSKFAEPVTIDEKIALTDAKVRAHVSYAVAAAFVFANILTLTGVGYIFHEDQQNVVAKLVTSHDRVITSHVVMAIVGATTVQLGALALTMGKYLYPAPRNPSFIQKMKGNSA